MFITTPKQGDWIESSVGTDVYPGWFIESLIEPQFDQYGRGAGAEKDQPTKCSRVLLMRQNLAGEVYPSVEVLQDRYIEHRTEQVEDDEVPLPKLLDRFLAARKAFLAEQRAKSTIGGRQTVSADVIDELESLQPDAAGA